MKPKLAALALLAVPAVAQSPAGAGAAGNPVNPKGIVIEAASIKPSDPASCKEYPIIDNHNDRYDLTCVRMRLLIQIAYGVRDFQISNGPGWLDTAQYDIHAKVVRSESDGGIPQTDVTQLTDAERRIKGEQLRTMLQSLLMDRMQLKVHTETRELPVYVLTISRGGPKVKSSAAGSDVSGGLRVDNGFLAGSRTDIPFLVQTLSQIVGRPILDRTGLNARYDFELKWTPDQSSPNGPLGGALPPLLPENPERPNIFTAIKDQLGLILTSGKGPVKIIVVDHVERPSAN